MRDIKKEKNLIGKENWPKIPIIKIKGTKGVENIPDGMSQEEGEKIIRTWEKVAVLKAVPSDVPFYIGFIVDTHAQYLKYEIETKDGAFGMRLGPEDPTFFAIAKDIETEINLELVEVSDISNTKYKDLPLY